MYYRTYKHFPVPNLLVLNLIGPILGLGSDEANYQGPAYGEDGVSETIVLEYDRVDEIQQLNDKGCEGAKRSCKSLDHALNNHPWIPLVQGYR